MTTPLWIQFDKNKKLIFNPYNDTNFLTPLDVSHNTNTQTNKSSSTLDNLHTIDILIVATLDSSRLSNSKQTHSPTPTSIWIQSNTTKI